MEFHKMGVISFLSIVRHFLGDKGPISFTGDKCGALAVDTGFLPYKAYEFLLANDSQITKDESGKYSTTMTRGEIETKIANLVISAIANAVEILNPEIVIVVLDGVPPFAKILEQKRRRIEGSNDLFNAIGEPVFSMSLFVPSSPLAELLDKELIDNAKIGGSVATVYSGPGTPGEGEHKIFPILSSIFRHGHAAINGVTESWKPLRSVYILANDNDMYILSALFLSTFTENSPQIYIYSEHATDRAENSKKDDSDKKTTSHAQFFSKERVKNALFYDACAVTNALTTDDAMGENRLEKLVNFVFYSCLLGNDFVPRISFGEDLRVIEFLKRVMQAAKTCSPFFETTSVVYQEKGTELRYIDTHLIPDWNSVLNFFNKFNDIFNANMASVAPSWSDDRAAENLRNYAYHNGIRAAYSNCSAIAAGVDYLRMMVNVVSYYVSSTCVVPLKVTDTHSRTMPSEYYAFGLAPPSISYLHFAAQLMAELQTDGPGTVEKYPKLLSTYPCYSPLSLELDKPAVPAAFDKLEFQECFTFPKRLLALHKNTESAFVGQFSAQGCPLHGYYQEKVLENTNMCILPYFTLERMRAIFGTNYTVPSVLTRGVSIFVDNDLKKRIKPNGRVDDALVPPDN